MVVNVLTKLSSYFALFILLTFSFNLIKSATQIVKIITKWSLDISLGSSINYYQKIKERYTTANLITIGLLVGR